MEHRPIYLDNASTSFPKADGVAEAMARYVRDIGCNVARGGYAPAFDVAEVVWETRERLCKLLGAPRPQNVIFTANVTMALNMALKGLLKPGDHLLISPLEHNAVMRPLTQLGAQGIIYDTIPLTPDGALDMAAAQALITPRTRGICVTHGSNVSGAILPAEELGALARQNRLFFLLDTAQTAGFLDISMTDLCIDGLAFTGHKGLLGPQGMGGIILSDALANALEPLISGGTGSMSDSIALPRLLPDRFEAGTPNLPGLYGLHAALGWLEETGLEALRHREIALAIRLEQGLAGLPGVTLVGQSTWRLEDGRPLRTPVISVDMPGQDNALISHLLAEEHGILTRCGLHCAPMAHRTLGTFPQGTVRFSPGHSTTREDVDSAIEAMSVILRR